MEVDQITKKLRAVLLKEHWDVLSQYNNQIQEGVKLNAKSNHHAKLGKLRKPMLAKSNNSASQKSLWVKNLSKTKQLSSSEQKVLEKGLNFAITPKRIPVLDIVASVKKGFKNVRNQSAVELARSKITQVLSNSRLPPPNLSPEEKKVLQELR